MVEIVHGWPPNIAEIRAVLPVSERNIFAYGGVVYAPGGTRLPAELIAHEEVHFRQQAGHAGGVEGWWSEFLESPAFRLSQEVEAHRVEYAEYCRLHPGRKSRRYYLKVVAKRLCAPMYGGLVSYSEARKLIDARS